MSNLPISRLINVDVNLTPSAAQAQNLTDLLVLGTSNVIDVTQRRRIYQTIADVAADFGTSAEEYLAALLWFEQTPQPTNLQIGRWANAATQGQVFGGPLSAAQQALAVFTAFTNPTFFFYAAGVPRSITAGSMAAVTNLNGVASILQTALAAAIAGSTVVWDSINDRFVLTTGGTPGSTNTVTFLSGPRALGSITFAANPLNNATITLNGTVVTFKTTPVGALDVLIGVDTAATLANLLTVLNGSLDVQIVKFTYSVIGNVLYTVAAAAGVGGNALTIAASVATPSGATLSGGSGTDVSAAIAMQSSSSGAYLADGVDAETAIEAATLFDQQFGQGWYAMTIPSADNDDHLAVAAYIEACDNKHIYGVTTQEAGVLVAVTTTDIAYLLNALGYSRTIVQYSSSNAYAVVSLIAKALSVDYTGNSTVITLMYKQEPGIVAESLTSTQMSALVAKGANVFVAYNNDTAIVEPGQVVKGNNVFIDMVTGIDWLAVTVMTALYNLLYTSTTKIPQTDAGMHLLVVTAEAVFGQGVTNGLLAPGVWNANGFGTLKQGDFLPKGFYIYAPPVALQNVSDRAARKSVPLQAAAKLAGAVHTVNFTINVNP